MTALATAARRPREWSFTIGVALFALLVLFALFYPALSPHDAFTSNFDRGASPDGEPVPPLHGFFLGTDRLFRDEAVRLALGARLSFYIAISASALAVVIGSFVGLIAGYFEGRFLDSLLMRLVDVGLSFPFLLLVMALGVVTTKTDATTVLLLLGVTGWLSIARIVRAKTIQLRARDFMLASASIGAEGGRLILRHLLPNLVPTMFVLFAIATPQMMMADSVLSYLGAGIAPPSPTLGYMLFEGQDVVTNYPWILAAPAITISLSVLALHLSGEGLEKRVLGEGSVR